MRHDGLDPSQRLQASAIPTPPGHFPALYADRERGREPECAPRENRLGASRLFRRLATSYVRMLFLRMWLMNLCWLGLLPTVAVAQGCVEVVPDEEYHCPYRAIPRGFANLLYLDTQTQWHHATNMYQPGDHGVGILEPLTPWGWLGGPISTSPDLERLILARSKPSCPAAPKPGPGLDCS